MSEGAGTEGMGLRIAEAGLEAGPLLGEPDSCWSALADTEPEPALAGLAPRGAAASAELDAESARAGAVGPGGVGMECARLEADPVREGLEGEAAGAAVGGFSEAAGTPLWGVSTGALLAEASLRAAGRKSGLLTPSPLPMMSGLPPWAGLGLIRAKSPRECRRSDLDRPSPRPLPRPEPCAPAGRISAAVLRWAGQGLQAPLAMSHLAAAGGAALVLPCLMLSAPAYSRVTRSPCKGGCSCRTGLGCTRSPMASSPCAHICQAGRNRQTHLHAA